MDDVADEAPPSSQAALDSAVLPNREKRRFVGDLEQKPQRAKIAVGQPHVALGNGLQHVVQERALGMAVGRQKRVAGQVEFRIHHHQNSARQRRRPGVAQRLQTMLGRRQMIAIENADAIAGQPGSPRTQFIDPSAARWAESRAQRLGNSQFDALEFLVNGLVAHRQRVLPFAIGGKYRRLSPENDRLHQLHHRREQQLALR